MTKEMDDALNVLGAWRTLHAHPLQVIYMSLRERAKRNDSKALVSQRLKRVPSIIVKLQRNQNMKLSTVQDIGGCRAVLSDIDAVIKLAKKYDIPVRDYISSPKADGYRSLHLVELYKPTIEKHELHSGRKIEVQLRTRLQHAWATAVETVDSLMGQNLKTGGGVEDWRRFFALASSVIAMKEGCALVPGTPLEKSALREEIKEISEKLDVFNRLDGLTATVETLSNIVKKNKKAAIYILVLDLKKRLITPWAFGEDQMEAAASFYLEKEKEHYGNSCMQIVQVSVVQLRDLKKAYPNYYLNAQDFLKALTEVL